LHFSRRKKVFRRLTERFGNLVDVLEENATVRFSAFDNAD